MAKSILKGKVSEAVRSRWRICRTTPSSVFARNTFVEIVMKTVSLQWQGWRTQVLTLSECSMATRMHEGSPRGSCALVLEWTDLANAPAPAVRRCNSQVRSPEQGGSGRCHAGEHLYLH